MCVSAELRVSNNYNEKVTIEISQYRFDRCHNIGYSYHVFVCMVQYVGFAFTCGTASEDRRQEYYTYCTGYF